MDDDTATEVAAVLLMSREEALARRREQCPECQAVLLVGPEVCEKCGIVPRLSDEELEGVPF